MTTRRDFLKLAGAGLLTPFVPGVLSTAREAPQADGDGADVFTLSIASGDPSPSGVVLWTRIDPAAYIDGQPLHFEVAASPNFAHPVASGEIAAADFSAEFDHTVHLDLDGWLQPNRVYYYRFLYGNVVSRTGRCRTLPNERAALASLKLAVVSCQDYTNGYYGAFAHIANDDVDFVLHLGDLIYESSGDPRYQSLPYPDRTFELPSGERVAVDLNDFRFLYKKYRSDPLFQQMLERHTLIAVWDDHETANDCYWDYERDTLGAPDHPFTEREQLLQLKLDAQRAWAEFVPARVLFNPEATHPHDYLQIYRQFRFGSLVQLFVTDERTYRSPHPCGEGDFDRNVTLGCGEQASKSQTMLGETQRTWFEQAVLSSNALWKVWANEVFLGQLKVGRKDGRTVYITLDGWDGYEAERRAILQAIGDHGVRNFVALTGDLHSYIAAYLKVDYSRRSNRPGANIVGVELMAPSITSATLIDVLILFLRDHLPEELEAAERSSNPRFYFENLVRVANPHIQFFDSQENGYAIVEFTSAGCTYTAFSVDTANDSANAARRLVRQLFVPVNQARIVDVV